MLINRIIIIISFSVLFISCRDTNTLEYEQTTYEYSIPIQTDDGWIVSSAYAVGLNLDKITDMVNYLEEETNHQIHSILIVKDSKLVFEKYFKGYKFDISAVQSPEDLIEYGIDTLHYLASVSKSITSLLLGIAIDHNTEIDVNEKLSHYYPEYSSILINEKAGITIGHLLTMSAGLSWDETTYTYGNPKNDVTQLFSQNDPIRYILEKSIESLPGTKFSYNSGYTNVLADIIRKQTNTPLLTFAEINLFNKLKIQEYKWDKINQNLVFASGGLYLSSRSLAKIGLIYLNDGKWNETKIISEEWIEQSLQNYMNPNYYFSNGYGFQWWKYTFQTIYGAYECYFAAGWGEQFLYLFPELEMTVVFTSGYYSDEHIDITPRSIINEFILYALQVLTDS